MERLTSFGVTFQEADAADQVFKGDMAEPFDALYIGCDAPGKPFSHIDWESAGIPRTDAFSLAASEPGIFAGGFSRTGKEKSDKQAYPIAFAAQGRKAATSIDCLLSGVFGTAGREREGAVSTRLSTDISRVVPQKRILSAVGDIRADGGAVSGETAAREADRCIQCDCSRCIRVCAYIAAFKGHPGQYAREIYNNAAIVMGERKANLLVNSCSLCGLCETVCPNDFSMADLCLEARRDMVEKGRMPVSAHAFALQEMAHASGSRCFFARHAPGKDRSDQPADRPDPGFSGRHDNLARAKHWMLSTLWGESLQDTPADESRPLHFAPGVSQIMEDAFILPHDIQAVLAHYETGAPHFEHRERDSCIAFYRPENVCFWVEFQENSSGYQVLNVWSHRMNVVEDCSFIPGSPADARAGGVTCRTCQKELEYYKHHVAYLGSRFDVVLPQCSKCRN
jgi:heterodisulfide reductase subunit C